jgi:hypothetical protein
MKIPNIFDQNPIVISQGRHTQGWGKMSKSVAIDFAYTGSLICPFDNCEVITYSNTYQTVNYTDGYRERDCYFGLKLPDGSLIIIAHAKPSKTGKLKKGERFSICTWHHYHLSIVVNGQLDCIMSYLDRSIATMTQASLYNNDKNHPDCRWETYPDKQLNILPPQNPLDMKYSEELAKLKNQPEVWNAPTMHNQNKYIFESGLPIAIAEELISKDVWANNTIANKDKQIADLKAELTQKPTVVEVENPVNDELQNKIDFLNRQNLAMAETVKIFKTEIDELRGQLDKFTTTQSFEPIMVTDPKTKEDLTKLEAGAGLAKKPTVGESPKVEIKQEPFKIRSESLKASLGVVKNVIPSVGTFLLAVGVTQDSTTQIVSFVTAGVSFLTAIYLEWDKTQYNAKEAEKKKI